MNKLLTILGTITLLSSVVSPLAFTNKYHNHTQIGDNRHHKFDIWNLSTRGVEQKQIIAKSYLEQASATKTLNVTLAQTDQKKENTIINESNINNNDIIKSAKIYNPRDLSTWGNKEKAVIVKSYLASAKKWYQSQSAGKKDWYHWCYYLSGSETIDNAFKLVCPNFWEEYTYFWYKPFPNVGTDLKIVFNKGIHFYMKSYPQQMVTGKIDFEIQGNI